MMIDGKLWVMIVMMMYVLLYDIIPSYLFFEKKRFVDEKKCAPREKNDVKKKDEFCVCD